MKASQRDDLIKLIDNTAGPVPSIISNALAVLEPFVAGMPTALAAWKTIRDANLKLGTSPGEELTKPGVILSLRQKVLALTVDEEPVVVAPPGPPSGKINVTPSGNKLPALDADGKDRTFLATPGTIYEAAITGPADRLGMSGDNGPVLFGCPGFPTGQRSNAASENGHFIAGDKMYVGIPASRGPTNIIYSALKYGG